MGLGWYVLGRGQTAGSFKWGNENSVSVCCVKLRGWLRLISLSRRTMLDVAFPLIVMCHSYIPSDQRGYDVICVLLILFLTKFIWIFKFHFSVKENNFWHRHKWELTDPICLFWVSCGTHTNAKDRMNSFGILRKATQIPIGELQETLRAMRTMVKAKLIDQNVSN